MRCGWGSTCHISNIRSPATNAQEMFRKRWQKREAGNYDRHCINKTVSFVTSYVYVDNFPEVSKLWLVAEFMPDGSYMFTLSITFDLATFVYEFREWLILTVIIRDSKCLYIFSNFRYIITDSFSLVCLHLLQIKIS